jgi:hypothetical protein
LSWSVGLVYPWAGATVGAYWNYRSSLRFCQHHTGEDYKSEEHLKTESKIRV